MAEHCDHGAWPHLVPESHWAQAGGMLLLNYIERETERDEWGGETWGMERVENKGELEMHSRESGNGELRMAEQWD